MSDREGSYGQSPLATLNMAYSMSQSRVSPSSASPLAPRRPRRASYRPSLSPPDIALPAPPSFATASTNAFNLSHQQPIRISNQSSLASGRGYTSHHPYSAQSLASTPDIDHDYTEGFPLHNDRNQRTFYRSQAHISPLQQPIDPTTNSQAQSHNFSGRLQNSSSSGSLQKGDSDLAYASASPIRDRTASVSPGSYFAAYPPVPAPSSRDRSDSESSAVSGGSSSHTASATAMSLSHKRPSTPPPLTQPPPQRTPPRSSNAAQASSSRHGSSHHRTRPSSRRALTAALELAKSAVLLDQTNDDPRGAVQAYANTVRLLGEVMDRVMRGDDAPSSTTAGVGSSDAAAEERRRRGRRRSGVVAKEEEVRRLKAIHDTYADRLTILCLIYSIPHPSPLDRPTGGPSASTHPNQVPQMTGSAGASSYGLPPQQIGSTVSLSESEQDTTSFPDAPEDIHLDEYSSREYEDTATIRRGHPSTGTDNELESDSDWERKVRSTDGPASRQRGTETPFSGYRNQQQQQNQYPQQILHDQNDPAHMGDGFNADTPRRLHVSGSTATPVPRGHSQDAPTSIPASHSLGAFRNSIIPPPRPPPSGPLPTRPRIANGTVIPPQLLNQPLPPLPPIQKPQSPSDITPSSSHHAPTLAQAQNQPQAQTLTRQSSASSVSGLSGASSNASGSSAASNLPGGQPANPIILLPNALPSLVSAALNAPPANATLSPPGSSSIAGRPRGNSNAHGRNLSNAERLVVVNEEKEEEEGTTRNTAAGSGTSTTPPPQEVKYRSRSSSMVSLKDRDRAKAQVLGNLGQAPLPPLPVVQRQSSSEALVIPSSAPSPNTTTSGAKATPRPRGSSVGSSVTQVSDDYIGNGSSPSTTPVANMPPYTADGAPAPSSAPIIVPSVVGGSGLECAIKLNANTKEGTISQRRSMAANAVPMSTGGSNQSGHGKLTSAILPAATATSLGLTGRNRASSNPGKWSAGLMSLTTGEAAVRPPMPPPPMSAGPRRHFPVPSAARYQAIGMPSPSGSANGSTASLVPMIIGAPIAGAPASAPPPAPPALAILGPYHLMSLLRKSMTERTGGFITPRLHVPHEVWTQGSAKLTNTAEKTKVIDVLIAALDELANASVDFCGASSAIASTVSDGDRKQAERWAGKLEDFDRAFNQVGMSFGKKLGVGEGFVVKKSVGVAAWSNKFFDKIVAAGKPYDSPMAYASMLTKLFGLVQLLDEHSRASQMSPQPPAYASLPQDVRNRIDGSLKSISELFAKVVLTFVFRDLSLMLDKYHKTCDRWMQSNPGNPA